MNSRQVNLPIHAKFNGSFACICENISDFKIVSNSRYTFRHSEHSRVVGFNRDYYKLEASSSLEKYINRCRRGWRTYIY